MDVRPVGVGSNDKSVLALQKTLCKLVADQPVFCSKGIIGGIQLGLRRLNVLVREIVELLVNQFVDDLPQFHHTDDTTLGSVGKFHLRHHGIFPVEHFAIYHRIAKILHGGVCGQRFTLRFRMLDLLGFGGDDGIQKT